VGAPDEPVLEGWTVLAGLAAVTGRIRLATLCTAVGYRNPAHLAKIAASVDLISRGRLTLGIGAGFFANEYKQYGWEFPPQPATRIRQMEEAVQLILKMWTEPRTTFHGRYFHVEDAILEPKPVQKPRPPVMIAGGGEQMTLRAVARLADACNIVDGDVAEVRHKFDVLRRHCDAVGRDYDTIEKTPHPTLGTGPRRGRGGGEARAAGCPRAVARLRRHRVRGHRSDRAIPGRRRRPADQCRSTGRRGDP
jgi:F420-dependent oxidoreductase-like protein